MSSQSWSASYSSRGESHMNASNSPEDQQLVSSQWPPLRYSSGSASKTWFESSDRFFGTLAIGLFHGSVRVEQMDLTSEEHIHRTAFDCRECEALSWVSKTGILYINLPEITAFRVKLLWDMWGIINGCVRSAINQQKVWKSCFVKLCLSSAKALRSRVFARNYCHFHLTETDWQWLWERCMILQIHVLIYLQICDFNWYHLH